MGKVAVLAVAAVLVALLFMVGPRGDPGPAPAPPPQPETAPPAPEIMEPPAADTVPTAEPAAEVPPFRFRVTDVTTGEPIAGVRIEPDADPGEEPHAIVGDPPLTDADGRASFVIPHPGFSATSYRASRRGYLQVRGIADRAGVTGIRMEAGAAVTGRVTRADTGAPVEGAIVRVWDVDEAREVCRAAVTDSSGEFMLDAAPPDERLYAVVRAAGFAPSLVIETLPGTGGRLELTVGGRGTLEGRVLRPDGSPGAGVEVWLTPTNIPLPPRSPGGHWLGGGERALLTDFLYPRMVTGDDGAFRFTGVRLHRDQYTVAKLSEFAEATSEAFRFEDHGETLVRDIRIAEPATAVIAVLDDRGEIVPDTQVDFRSERVWFDARNAGTPLEDGRVRVEGIAPGHWKLRAWLRGAEAVEKEVDLAPGEAAEIEFRPDAGTTIEGVVLGPEGEPVPYCDVRAIGSSFVTGATDERGRFRLALAENETVAVEASPSHFVESKDGRPYAPATVEGVRPGGEPLRIVLPLGGFLTGRIDDAAEGEPFRIETYSKKTSGRSSLAIGANGAFRTRAPEPGTPFLLVFGMADRPPLYVERAALRPGEDLDLGTLEFAEGNRLTGRVVGDAGQPIASAEVKLIERWLDSTARTDAEGRFRFEGLPKRRIWARVSAPGYPMHLAIFEPPGTGPEPVVRMTRGGLLKAEVSRADGSPLDKGTFLVSWLVNHPLAAELDDLRYYRAFADGGFEIRLQPGRYRVRVYDDLRDQHAVTVVEIGEGATTEERIRLATKREAPR